MGAGAAPHRSHLLLLCHSWSVPFAAVCRCWLPRARRRLLFDWAPSCEPLVYVRKRLFPQELAIAISDEAASAENDSLEALLAGRVMHPVKWDVLANSSRFDDYMRDQAQTWPQSWSGCVPDDPISLLSSDSSWHKTLQGHTDVREVCAKQHVRVACNSTEAKRERDFRMG